MTRKQIHLKKDVQMVELVVLDKGKNIHVTVPFGKKYQIDDQTYDPKRENLFLVKNFMHKPKFVCVFHKDGTAVNLETPLVTRTVKLKDGKTKKVEVKQKVTSETLHIAHNSQSLKSGLADIFSNPMNTRKIMFLLIIGAAAVVIYMVMSGALVL